MHLNNYNRIINSYNALKCVRMLIEALKGDE